MTEQQAREVIASRLRDWMEARPDLDTQVKVARASGVSQTTMSRLLNAQTGVTIDNLEAVAAAFGRTTCELIAPMAASGLFRALQSCRVFDLPAEAQDRIAAFVTFTAEQVRKPVLNIEQVVEIDGPVRQAVRRAASRKRVQRGKAVAQRKRRAA